MKWTLRDQYTAGTINFTAAIARGSNLVRHRAGAAACMTRAPHLMACAPTGVTPDGSHHEKGGTRNNGPHGNGGVDEAQGVFYEAGVRF